MKFTCTFSGVGGQGIMSIGELYCSALSKHGKKVTFCPTYGAEKRGGRTMCQIVVSDELCSPIVGKVEVLLVMDERSLHDFGDTVADGGMLIINSDLITTNVTSDEYQVVKLPFSVMANRLGNAKCANMIALGAVMKMQSMLSLDELKAELPSIFTGKKEKLIPLNEKALDAGYNAIGGAKA